MDSVQKAGHVKGARATQWLIGPADMDGEEFSREELKVMRHFLHAQVPVTQLELWQITKERWTETIVYFYASKVTWSPGVKYGAYTLDALLKKMEHHYERMRQVEEKIKKYDTAPSILGLS